MLIDFFHHLKAGKLPVSTKEFLTLLEALQKHVAGHSIDEFYYLSRACLVKDESDYDKFDKAFGEYFKGVERIPGLEAEIPEDWLRLMAKKHLTPEEKAKLQALGWDRLMEEFKKRLQEQKKRHAGGSKWIGTGGSSPFGAHGYHPEGIRIGAESAGNRTAVKVWENREYRNLDDKLELGTRNIKVALRRLRRFAREGAEEELDLEGTIDETARNAGELEVVTRPPRRPNLRVLLLMDVGGSMDPYADLVSRLFSAASKATHWKELRSYYFHNCVYGRVYKTEAFRDPVDVHQVLSECGPHWKLIVVGDALMAPYELLSEGGALYLDERRGQGQSRGIDWLHLLTQHFHRSAWLNPEPPQAWQGNTIEAVREVFAMFPLTLAGLEEAVGHLTRGGTGARR